MSSAYIYKVVVHIKQVTNLGESEIRNLNITRIHGRLPQLLGWRPSILDDRFLDDIKGKQDFHLLHIGG
jgi:hypothetical protein